MQMKLRPARGVELAGGDPVWDGEGWGVTGSRVSVFSRYWLVLVGAGGGDRRAAVAKRDPHIRIALRLTLDEAVSGLGPGHDVFVLVVEDDLAYIGIYRHHRLALALL